MSSPARGLAEPTEGIVAACADDAIRATEAIRGVSVGLSDTPGVREAYLEAERLVFLLKIASKEEGAPPYDSSLERLGRSELVTKMAENLAGAKEQLPRDKRAALRLARVARDCGATVLHSLNLEARRRRR